MDEYVYIIKHIYTVPDGEWNYVEERHDIVGLMYLEEDAKKYCEKYARPHAYKKYGNQCLCECGELVYEKVKPITLFESPSELGHDWAFNKDWLKKEKQRILDNRVPDKGEPDFDKLIEDRIKRAFEEKRNGKAN